MDRSITHSLNFALLSLLLIFSGYANSQVSEEWLHRYTGPEPSTDTPADFVIDDDGNFYVTGQSTVGGGYADIITVKYNSSGVRQWIARYNGAANLFDNGNSVKVDSDGNVYVSGNTYSPAEEYNIVVIKYGPNGNELWVRQYNGPGNFEEIESGSALDENGNLYVCGSGYAAGTRFDFVLLKYNSSGDLQWIQRWNGVSNLEDNPKKISLTGNGDIIVSGITAPNSSSLDFVTLKYNSAGSLLWERIYNGPLSSTDILSDMKTDQQDNVYICGRTPGPGTGNDYALIKYSSAGTQQWVSFYNSPSSNDDVPTAIDLDLNGNIYLTGYSFLTGSFHDFSTVKYNSSGALQWVRNYNGSENYYDKAFDVKTDIDGNVFVTGQVIKFSDGTTDAVTLKYNSSGTLLWSKNYDGPGNLDDNPVRMKTDKSGALMIIVNSYSYFLNPLCGSSDYLTVKYNSNGGLDWETRYDGAGAGIDEANDLAIDEDGNTFSTGFSSDVLTGFDYATLKYNSAGAPLWVARYDNNNGTDKATSVTTDKSGNIYVTGYSQGSGSGFDIATLKYNSLGTQLWVSRYNGSANSDDRATGIEVDAFGNVYVSGYREGTGSGKDFITIKYNSIGAQQWAQTYNGPGNSDDLVNAIMIDVSGNVYVTGKSNGTGSLEDIATIKYNSSGAQVWVARFNGAANNSDISNSLSVDQSGNVIVTGKSMNAGPNYDMITVKYNTSGAQQWAAYYAGSGNGDDEAKSIVTDNSGNIYLTGTGKNNITGLDYTTIKYNPAGLQQWASVYNGTSNGADVASSIDIDLAGNLFVTGESTDLVSNLNYSTLKYNNKGELKWIQKYNYTDNDSDKAIAVKVDSEGSVYVTGKSKGFEGGLDYTTIKYKQDKTIELKAFIEGFYNEISNSMIADTMKIYLRNSSPPYSIADSSEIKLDNAGRGTFIFLNSQNGLNYYIVLSHRNSIETWSSAGISFLAGSMNYDFTSGASQAFGNNLVQKGSVFCIYSGDVTKDGIVDAADMALIDNDAFKFISGYIYTDLNGDEIIDGSDLGIADNNAINFISVIRP